MHCVGVMGEDLDGIWGNCDYASLGTPDIDNLVLDRVFKTQRCSQHYAVCDVPMITKVYHFDFKCKIRELRRKCKEPRFCISSRTVSPTLKFRGGGREAHVG